MNNYNAYKISFSNDDFDSPVKNNSKLEVLE